MINLKTLSKPIYKKYEYLIIETSKLTKRAKLGQIKVIFIKSHHVNAGIDIQHHLLIITSALVMNTSSVSQLGMLAHEVGHLISLHNLKVQEKYHLYTNSTDKTQQAIIKIKAEYVADELATKLVGIKPILNYLQESKNILLKQARLKQLIYYQHTYKYLPTIFCKMLVKYNAPKAWYADDYQAPTLDGRIKKLSQMKN